jgi:hypothetical protein
LDDFCQNLLEEHCNWKLLVLFFLPWWLLCTFVGVGSIGYLLAQEPGFITIGDLLLLNFINPAGNVTALSLLADEAFLKTKLFLNLCNHPLLAVTDLVSLI